MSLLKVIAFSLGLLLLTNCRSSEYPDSGAISAISSHNTPSDLVAPAGTTAHALSLPKCSNTPSACPTDMSFSQRGCAASDGKGSKFEVGRQSNDCHCAAALVAQICNTNKSSDTKSFTAVAYSSAMDSQNQDLIAPEGATAKSVQLASCSEGINKPCTADASLTQRGCAASDGKGHKFSVQRERNDCRCIEAIRVQICKSAPKLDTTSFEAVVFTSADL